MSRTQVRVLLVVTALVAMVAMATATVFVYDTYVRAGTQGELGTVPVTPAVSMTPVLRATVAITALPTPSGPTTIPTRAAPPPAVALTAPTGANVRAGPGLDYQILGVITSGATVPATGRDSGGWLWVESAHLAGWVAANVVLVEGDVEALPLVPAAGPAALTPTPTATPIPTPPPPAPATATATAVALGVPDLDLRDVSLSAAGRLVLTLANSGTGPLVDRAISITVEDAAGVALAGETTRPVSIAAGSSVSLELVFRPRDPGELTVIVNGDGAVDELSSANNRRKVTVVR